MPKASTTVSSKAEPPYAAPTSKNHVAASSTSLKSIDELRKCGLTKHSKAANTTRKYTESVAAARKWLKASTGNTSTQGKKKEIKSGEPAEDSDCSDDGEDEGGGGPDLISPDVEGGDGDNPDDSFTFDSPEYQRALDDTPNKHSPKVLSLFLAYKIFHQGRKIGTADTSRAAYKELWKMVDGDKYRGRWHLNPDSGEYEGNPVESAEVEDTMRAIKNKCGQDSGDRTHSLAMTKEYMEKMFAWSDTICPPATYFSAPQTREELTLRTKHLMFKAFSSTGWTIWSRNFELIKLQEKDLTFGLEDSQAFNTPYFELRLRDRKGWQKKINKARKEADLRSGKYKISAQPDLPACDAYHWLPLWRRFLQEMVYHRLLGPDDYIFPAIGANGVVQVGEHVSHDDVQKLIKEFTTGAKLPQTNGNFTTHCFRRGGAQYRFMFAPIGRRWTLRQVRWWGGWAEGEHRDTLIKYLLDELGTYEDDYSGMLLPNQPNLDQTFLGEGSSFAAATTGQLTLLHQSLSADVRAVFGAVNGLVQSLANNNEIHNNFPGALVTSHPLSATPVSQTSNPHQMLHRNSLLQTNAFPRATTHAITPILLNQPIQNNPLVPHGPPSLPLSHNVVQVRTANVLSTPHLVVPDIPVRLPDGTRSHPRDSWRYVVDHWLCGDPAHGLHTPLKDWPDEWLQGANKKFQMKRFGRMVIATEFITLHNSNEQSFLSAFPEANEGYSKLLAAVNAAREARGSRKPRK
ncbi:hypothetical protein B0H11DRAFT_1937995 [Mycena galericulata]|nr:hypothetical protein B0H11DRAFT_1937995 [Mycena galericulata]